ncbi:signal peptidase II [Pseudoduganella albidiflava]|uniref:Lipoprotein signal peptidase n=1 Tax=Pseudoduganella albidiflava TaxID=321983 RepID=A0A411WXG7_9BURK|nr:signal peptidase II [Pseudoduganella albidiflava]QBI01332.1 signal peptidase II [Pseudoduganella albidiflava]GGY36506.1 lipoprotein signal peptidase [Pseudoduganella albidiflava]
MNRLGRTSLLLLVLFSCVGCDQATKQLVRVCLPDPVTYSFWGDFVRLQHVQNHGAFLNLGATLPEPVRFAIFTIAIALVLAGLVAYAIRKPGIITIHVVAIALIAGGGAGNLIDRILFGGGVTDFLNIGIGPLRTGIFNVADVAIMAGAGLLLYRGRRGGGRAPGSR